MNTLKQQIKDNVTAMLNCEPASFELERMEDHYTDNIMEMLDETVKKVIGGNIRDDIEQFAPGFSFRNKQRATWEEIKNG